MIARLARDVNCMADPDRFKRKRALDTLSKELFDLQTVSCRLRFPRVAAVRGSLPTSTRAAVTFDFDDTVAGSRCR